MTATLLFVFLCILKCTFEERTVAESEKSSWTSIITQQSGVQQMKFHPVSYSKYNTNTQSESCVINYPQGIAYRRGSTINVTPTHSCTVTSWSVAPSLPSYLQFGSDDGSISGTVEEVLEAVFTITAVTYQGSVRVVYILAVVSDGCEAEGVWPFTLGQEIAAIQCYDEYNYVGTLYRPCEGYFSPHWGAITGNCSLGAPYDLQYPYQSVQAYLNHNLSPVIPTYRGKGSSFSLESSLPSGMVLNEEDGSITGIPNGEEGCMRVRVSLHNEVGSCSSSFEICVLDGKVRVSSTRRTLSLLWKVCSVVVGIICLAILVFITYCTLRKYLVY